MELVFKALADKNRRQILKLLRRKDMSVQQMQKHFPFTQASLSHHLDILKRADLVITERQGQSIYYSLNVSVFEEVMAMVLEFFKK